MRIVADRFLVADGDAAEDLATGASVRLRFLPPADALDEAAWNDRCAALYLVRDPLIERLVDYGIIGAGRRFEALRRPPPATEQDSTSRPALGDDARRSDRRGGVASLEVQLVELLESGERAGVRSMVLRATSEAMLDDACSRAARLGRLHGYVPLSVTSASRHPFLFDAVIGRHVLLFRPGRGPGSDDACAARLVLTLGRSSRRSHIVLVPIVASDGVHTTGEAAPPRLEPVGVAQWGDARSTGAEQAPAGSSSAMSTEVSRCAVGESRPAYPRGGVSVGAARMEGAVALGLEAVRRGRHALGHRRLRQAIAGLDRRGHLARAADAALSMGVLLLVRGQAKAAVMALEGACRRFDASGRIGDLAIAQAYLGLALTDDARLHDAESVLRAVQLVARDSDRVDLRRLAPVALARCLLWQGRSHEAGTVLERSDDDKGAADSARLRVLARVAIASCDLASAGRLAWAALETAVRDGQSLEVGRSHGLVAVVEARAGNREGLRRHVESGLRAARLGQARADVWRLRITLLEGLLRIGGARTARAVALRMARRRIDQYSTLVRARLSQALAAALPDADAATAWRHFARGVVTGRGAAGLETSPDREPRMDIINELVEVLSICQTMEEEPARLTAVCRTVKTRLGALSVALTGGLPQTQVILAEAGRPRPGQSETAARIVETGLVIPPARLDDAVEAGAPIRYGGDVVGALVCRWAPDQSPDAARVEALLSTAAAACAPSVRTALDRLMLPCPEPHPEDLGIVGVSRAADAMRAAARRAACAPFPVVITGESGSGKEVVARAVHRLGTRRHRRLAALNCAALNDELVDSELFGHARGAFSGALHERIGVFEDADGGTLFLDEVSELSTRAQAKLLRTLQEGEIRRVGENVARRVDVRLVAATNRDLWADVEAGRFRRDLLYRLDVIRIAVPPLRDRIEDIAVLASHFWSQSTSRVGSRATLTPDLLGALARHDWPGNVRELQNVMAALAVAAPIRGRVGRARLAEALPRADASPTDTEPNRTLEHARQVFERRYVRAVLAREGGHQARTASALGLTRQGLAKLLARLDRTAAPDGGARGG